MGRKLAIDPRQIEHRCSRTHLVVVLYFLFKAERIKQLSLVLLQPTHHGSFPPLTASTSGNHCSRKPSTDFCNKICQFQTHALQQTVSLFHQLVCACEQCGRHVETKSFGGFEVDHQLEFCRLQDRQIAWLGTFENPASIDAD